MKNVIFVLVALCLCSLGLSAQTLTAAQVEAYNADIVRANNLIGSERDHIAYIMDYRFRAFPATVWSPTEEDFKAAPQFSQVAANWSLYLLVLQRVPPLYEKVMRGDSISYAEYKGAFDSVNGLRSAAQGGIPGTNLKFRMARQVYDRTNVQIGWTLLEVDFSGWYFPVLPDVGAASPDVLDGEAPFSRYDGAF